MHRFSVSLKPLIRMQMPDKPLWPLTSGIQRELRTFLFAVKMFSSSSSRLVHSCKRPAVRTRSGEAGGLRRGRSADRHADQEGNLRGNAVLDGAWSHPAVCLRLKGQAPVYFTANASPGAVWHPPPSPTGLFLFWKSKSGPFLTQREPPFPRKHWASLSENYLCATDWWTRKEEDICIFFFKAQIVSNMQTILHLGKFEPAVNTGRTRRTHDHMLLPRLMRERSHVSGLESW